MGAQSWCACSYGTLPGRIYNKWLKYGLPTMHPSDDQVHPHAAVPVACLPQLCNIQYKRERELCTDVSTWLAWEHTVLRCWQLCSAGDTMPLLCCRRATLCTTMGALCMMTPRTTARRQSASATRTWTTTASRSGTAIATQCDDHAQAALNQTNTPSSMFCNHQPMRLRPGDALIGVGGCSQRHCFVLVSRARS